MLLIKLNDQGGIARYPYTSRMLKNDHPNVSLPKNPDDSTLEALGAVRVQTVPRPSGDVVTEGTPEKQPDGTWQQTWDVRSFTAEEKEERFKSSIPSSITPRQARLALLQKGLLSQVESSLDALPSSEKESAKIEWEYATSVERSSLWVKNLGKSLSLTERQIDKLFLLGETL